MIFFLLLVLSIRSIIFTSQSESTTRSVVFYCQNVRAHYIFIDRDVI